MSVFSTLHVILSVTIKCIFWEEFPNYIILFKGNTYIMQD